jgi:phosphohistidine phosphatase
MKTILLLRHGKSDWSNPRLSDFDRPLAKRGLKDVPRMGKVLIRFDSAPDLIISSSAKRAKKTAKLAAKACGYKGDFQWEDILYFGYSADLMTTLRRLPDSINRPLVVGHNPTLADTISVLCHFRPTSKLEDIRLPTAGLVCISADIPTWDVLKPGDGVLKWFIIPKLVKAL